MEAKPTDSAQPTFYILLDGKVEGPYTRERIEEMLAHGEILPTTLTQTDATEGWLPCEKVLRGETKQPKLPAKAKYMFEEKRSRLSELRERLPQWMQVIIDFLETGFLEESEFLACNIRFYGRLNRLPYFLSSVLVWMLSMLTLQGELILVRSVDSGFLRFLVIMLYVPIMIVLFVWSISIVVRRLHDIGCSGLWVLLIFAPNFIGILAGLFDPFTLAFREGSWDSMIQTAKTRHAFHASAWGDLITRISSLCLLYLPGTRGRNAWGNDPKW